MARNLSTPLSSTWGDDDDSKKSNAKKPKNYNYQNKVNEHLKEYPTALGRVTEDESKRIEKSFEPKRKEWSKSYDRGEMTKRAYQDSVASTLAPGSKVKDFTKGKYKPAPKKVDWWIGGSAAKPWVKFTTPKIWPGGEKKTK